MARRPLQMLSIVVAFAVAVEGQSRTILGLGSTPKDPKDPENVRLVREALAKLGFDPEGIQLKTFIPKWWATGWSYMVMYHDISRHECTFNFQWNVLKGLETPETPVCSQEPVPRPPPPPRPNDC